MSETVHVAGIAGSLRKASYNRALLREAGSLMPDGAELEIVEIRDMPLFSQDLEDDPPAPVASFREKVRRADALLIATPEYNYSVPGPLKNAIDWASRPPGHAAIVGKPLALMGASSSTFGTVRAQLALRQIAVYLDMHLVNKPELLITRAAEKFDEQGRLTDEAAKDVLRDLLARLVAWTRRLGN